MVLSAGEGQGLEAWRRLNRRWDPIATWCSKKLWESIRKPGKARVEDLTGSIERLEDLLRRSTAKRKTEADVTVEVAGIRITLGVLDEGVKMASLLSLLPEEVEQHVNFNRAELSNYSLLRAEVMRYAEEKQTATTLSLIHI